MNHENMRRIRNLESDLEDVLDRVIRLEAVVRARLKEEAEDREAGLRTVGSI